jgi:hypothetical protein
LSAAVVYKQMEPSIRVINFLVILVVSLTGTLPCLIVAMPVTVQPRRRGPEPRPTICKYNLRQSVRNYLRNASPYDNLVSI